MTKFKLLGSMLTLALALIASVNAYAGNGNGNGNGNGANNGNGGGNGKVLICHRTSSAKNPYNLIEVSVNAAPAHYGHGDPVDFTILGNGKCAPSEPNPPTVELSLELDTIFVGDETTATWITTNTTSCTLSNGATSSPAVVGPYDSEQTVTLTVSCTGPNGNISDSATLTVLPQGEPSVELTFEDGSELLDVFVGEEAIVVWDAQDVDSCELSTGATESPASVVFDASGEYELTVFCSGPFGDVEDSITLVVNDLEPSVSLSLDTNTIYVGEEAIATWSAENVDSCELDNGATESPAAVSFDVPGDYLVEVFCTGPYGDVSAAVPLKVLEALPDLPEITQLEVSPTIIETLTGTATIAWDSLNAESCTLDYGAADPVDVAVSGSLSVGNYDEGLVSIVLTCENAAGVVSADVNLLVETPELLCGIHVPGSTAPHLMLIDYYPVSGMALMEYADDADTLIDLQGFVLGGEHWTVPGNVLELSTGQVSNGSVLTGTTGVAFNFAGGAQIGFTLPATCEAIGLGR